MNAAKPRGRPRGRPFGAGADPRRNTTSGRRPNPATAALREAVGDQDLRDMWRAGIGYARDGSVQWAGLIAAYLDGKPIARAEQGEPGDFERPDLSEFSTEDLKAAIRAVKG